MKKSNQMKELKKQLYSKNYINFIMTIFSLILNSILIVGISYPLQLLVDAATNKKEQEFKNIIFIIIFIIFLMIIGWILQSIFESRFIFKALTQYKSYAFEKIMYKNISLFSSESYGYYLTSFTNDVNSIEQNYISSLFELITNGIFFSFSLIMMVYYNVPLTIFVLSLSLLSILISFILGKKLSTLEKNISEKYEVFFNTIKDLLSGFSVIKSFKAEKYAIEQFKEDSFSIENTKKLKKRSQGFVNTIAATLSFLVQAGTVIIASFFILRGQITVGAVIAYTNLMAHILLPAQIIPIAYAKRQSSKILIQKLANTINIDKQEKGQKISVLEDSINLENVSFSFNDDKDVIKKFNFKFEAQKSYAIVGASGSGKSTLLKLMLGEYSDYRGKISIDNKDLVDIGTSSLHDVISIVQQNVFIFDNTIKNNITMFKDFDDNDIKTAISQSGLKTLIKEKGFDYECGDNGRNLSGGEKQRISIARSVLKKSLIFFMDEGTASLDSKTAFEVENAILDINNVTKIIVTHKLNKSLLSKYDEILVLHNGELHSHGNFEELIKEKSYFYSMYNLSQGNKGV